MSFKFWSKFFFYSVLAFFFFSTLLNYIVNPYVIFDHKLFASFLMKKEHILSSRTAAFYEARRADPKNLMMGTSNIGLLPSAQVDKYLGESTFNMAIAGSNIEEQSQYLLYMINNSNIKNIIWSLDFFSFNPDLPTDKSFNYNRLTSSFLLNDDYNTALFSLQATQNSLKTLLDNLNKSNDCTPYQYRSAIPLKEVDHTKEMIEEKTRLLLKLYPETLVKNKVFDQPSSITDNLKRVKEVVDLCNKKNINLYLYTPPIGDTYLDLHKDLRLEKTFSAWKQGLSKITSYTDFSTYNSISKDPYNFVDGIHIMPNFGELIFAKIFHDPSVDVPSDFGTYVPKDSQRTP